MFGQVLPYADETGNLQTDRNTVYYQLAAPAPHSPKSWMDGWIVCFLIILVSPLVTASPIQSTCPFSPARADSIKTNGTVFGSPPFGVFGADRAG